MKKLGLGLIFAIPIALFGRVAYLVLLAPSSDAASLDHLFRQAAYTVTWAIQLGYLAWLGMKWRAQKCEAERAGSLDHPGNSSSR
jgi:hypothetical protein